MKIELIKIGELKFADYNPRQITEKQVEDLKASITKFGVVEPVVVNKHAGRENIIIGGHQRVRILTILGYTEVPVFYLDLEESAERELNVRLNKNTGSFDWDKLANEFNVDDLLSWGFNKNELGMADDTSQIDTDNLDKALDSYLDGNIRQVVLYFKKDEYEALLPRLQAVMEKEKVEDHTNAVLKMLEHYERTHPPE